MNQKTFWGGKGKEELIQFILDERIRKENIISITESAPSLFLKRSVTVYYLSESASKTEKETAK